ncbi:MAG: hypothetical protein QM526_01255 [Alphaproteobacteria bacterium]|nr:hypothetical protein [Alphaproteobacteria bacterium]
MGLKFDVDNLEEIIKYGTKQRGKISSHLRFVWSDIVSQKNCHEYTIVEFKKNFDLEEKIKPALPWFDVFRKGEETVNLYRKDKNFYQTRIINHNGLMFLFHNNYHWGVLSPHGKFDKKFNHQEFKEYREDFLKNFLQDAWRRQNRWLKIQPPPS